MKYKYLSYVTNGFFNFFVRQVLKSRCIDPDTESYEIMSSQKFQLLKHTCCQCSSLGSHLSKSGHLLHTVFLLWHSSP